MSEPFLAEIRIVGFNFAPRGWAFCDGQLLPINQNQSLYSLLGTTYGGDGRVTFGLPDLRGRVPIHMGNSNTPGSTFHSLGQRSGEENHTLSENELPAHSHSLPASGDSATSGSLTNPPNANNVLAGQPRRTPPFYTTPGSNSVNMRTGSIGASGGGSPQAHENMQPFLTIRYVIALQGLFPSRN